MIEKFKTNAEVIETGDKYLYGNHVRMPISMERGEGVYVFDKDGNKYLDFVGGIAVNGLGHCHPAIVKCLQERAETILHCSNYFYNEPAVQTAKLIVENSCFDKVLFANSGAEANEGQIKLARKYAKDHGLAALPCQKVCEGLPEQSAELQQPSGAAGFQVGADQCAGVVAETL